MPMRPPPQGCSIILHSLTTIWVGNPFGRPHFAVWPKDPKAKVVDLSQSRLDGLILHRYSKTNA